MTSDSPSASATGAEPSSSPLAGTIYSFVVDKTPRFAYEGYHLAHSLIEHCDADPGSIFVHVTPEVDDRIRRVFVELGCQVSQLERFGDGHYCNKIAQMKSLQTFKCERLVLLDTDMIVVSDFRPFLGGSALQAKLVDMPNPSLKALEELARRAGMSRLPGQMETDGEGGPTLAANANGGFYAIPGALVPRVAQEWRRWAAWLLENIEPLRKEGMEKHVDQVSMWLAIHLGGIPFSQLPSNVNYFVHMARPHRYWESGKPIAVLHYHQDSIDVVGKLSPPVKLNAAEADAVARANSQIGRHFCNDVFWALRYSQFPERGSGVGSRGQNADYKRKLLLREKVLSAEGILDVGCGDLEVLRELPLRGYLGVDQSDVALGLARKARPDWQFQRLCEENDGGGIPQKDWVLCFEVLIHQETKDAYRKLVEFIAAKTQRTLIVSGYGEDNESFHTNPMLFYYEPLEATLAATRRFRSIKRIGQHSDVIVLRCDV